MLHSQSRFYGYSLLKNTSKVFTSLVFVRERNTRPDPKWRKQRREKVLRIELPDWEKLLGDSKVKPSLEDAKKDLKKLGMIPPRRYDSKVLNVQCTSGIFEPYVPPEGDGKASLISTKGAKDTISMAAMKTRSVNAVRKIRNFDESFRAKLFAEEGFEIYKQAQQALGDYDKDKLHELVTEQAFQEMLGDVESRFQTIRWKFIKLLEPVKVVHVRTTDLLGASNIFAQCTVRIHSQQMLAVFDRFGRLMYGSEVLPKTALEYVVFERQMANEYGSWRVHGKIIPDWMPPPQPLEKTIRMESEDEASEEELQKPKSIILSRSTSA